MRPRLVVSGFLLVAAASVPVAAATVRNLVTKPQTVSIFENGKKSETMLAANVSKTDICDNGCEMMHGTHELTLTGSETVSITIGRPVVQNRPNS